jgi:CBS domain-containing protein
MMKVEQLMTSDVRTCHPGDPLNAAARIMWERDCGCVPVAT